MDIPSAKGWMKTNLPILQFSISSRSINDLKSDPVIEVRPASSAHGTSDLPVSIPASAALSVSPWQLIGS